jgi:hypothetical protein
MNVRRVLGLGLFTFLMCAAVAASCQPANPPQTYVKVPATITLGDLSPQQLQDRAEELTTTTSTTVRQPSTTVAYVDPLTKCQEWLPVAVSVGWPNNTETLEKLGRLIWKETRCLNIGYQHPNFNGSPITVWYRQTIFIQPGPKNYLTCHLKSQCLTRP